MNFVSFPFLALFLIVYSLRLTIGRKNHGGSYFAFLVVASLVFYAWHIPAYLFVLLASAIVDYLVSLRLSRITGHSARNFWLSVSIVTNLSLLGFFKYFAFAIQSANWILARTSVDFRLPLVWDIVLPMGISFYTFQTMSYTIDVYRGRLKPERSFIKYLLYVSFFPQLVAGPIVRAKDFLYQLSRSRGVCRRIIFHGIYLISRGLFLKMVVADNLAHLLSEGGRWYWNAGYGQAATATDNLIRVLIFACQIFGDFAGYSDIARGLCYLFGFTIPLNFNAPYVAGTFSEFWRRWHISLSTWLRDYLYIPLGGNRVSKARTYINLMVVMLLGGLWHGAAWNFVIWGGIHGIGLAVERALGLNERFRNETTERSMIWMAIKLISRVVWYMIVQGTVLLSWVFFRSDTPHHAVAFVRRFFSGAWPIPGFDRAMGLLPVPHDIQVTFVTLPLAFVTAMHLRTLINERWPRLRPSMPAMGFWCAVMLYVTVTGYGRVSEFIYFAF